MSLWTTAIANTLLLQVIVYVLLTSVTYFGLNKVKLVAVVALIYAL